MNHLNRSPDEKDMPKTLNHVQLCSSYSQQSGLLGKGPDPLEKGPDPLCNSPDHWEEFWFSPVLNSPDRFIKVRAFKRQSGPCVKRSGPFKRTEASKSWRCTNSPDLLSNGPDLVKKKLAVIMQLMHSPTCGFWSNGYKFYEGYKYLKIDRFEDKRKAYLLANITNSHCIQISLVLSS